MWAAILFWKEERDLLSLISLGIEFQRCAPSYIKLFFILLVRGFGKLRPLEMSRLKDLKRQHLIQNVMSLYYLGRNLTTMVSSTYNISYLSSCAAHCFNTSTACVGFKYRSSINPQPNCELFKAMRICNSKPKNTTHGGTWQFYEAVRDKPVRWIHTVYW